MKFDKNTVIGFVVLAVLFVGYFIYTSKEQAAYMKKKAIEDSIENAKHPKPRFDTLTTKTDSLKIDSLNRLSKEGVFKSAGSDSERLVYAENDLIKIAFTNKGGQPKWVELKKFKNQDSTFVKLAATDFDKIDYTINTGPNSSASITDMIFSGIDSVKTPDSTVITFTLRSKDSASSFSVTHRFVLKKDDYMLDFTVQMNGADKLLTQNTMNLSWQYKAVQQESDIAFEKQNTQIGYSMGGDFDYNTAIKRSSEDFNKPVQWIGVRQRFFNTILVAKNDFSSGKMNWVMPSDSEKTILRSTADMQIKLPPSTLAVIPLSIYYGPADYHILQKYHMRFEKLINLGQGLYAFVRPVNRFLIMPIFDFMKGFVGSYGLAIALLTIIIRLLISPLTYTSYLSGAKMKVLRPEIAALKAKVGGDQQQMQMEQMKLFREAGVNPLGGCIPALLQIPIFFALYSFFNSNVALRGESFLWAKDLSAYDVFINFGVKVPLLGSHLSLFTITAVITSLLISLYSMSMTPDQGNPVLKYMPYIFPVFLLFIFNRLPSALTWYYTVSNLITLAIQYVIQTYIIDHDKILANIEATRKKPKTKTKWQERFEQMQEQQKRMKQIQQKGKK
ncbi:MAG TPA: membrane protein insertase YidC [Chitinophagaceae bacterium]|nr:membrane protein insertase YidC [Chitinophagaceae bacterium]